MMVAEHNQTGVTGDGGDNSGTVQLLIYHSTNRTSWTLKNTLIIGAVGNAVASMVVDSAGNIHVAYRGSGTSIWYTKGTFSAGPTWAFSAGASVATTQSGYNSMSMVDIDTIGNSTTAVVIGSYWYNTVSIKQTAFVSYVKATTGGAWINHPPVVGIPGDIHLSYADDMSISGDNIGGLTSTTGYFAWHMTRKAASGIDYGDVVYVTEVNTSTGAWMSRKQIQAGIYKGAGGGFRKFWLFNTAANEYTLAGVVDSSDFKTALYKFVYVRATGLISSQTAVATSGSKSTALWRRTNNHNWAAVAHNGEGKFFFFAIAGGAAVSSVGYTTVDNKCIFDSGWAYWDNRMGSALGFYDTTGKVAAQSVGWLHQIWSGATRNWGRPRLDVSMFYHSDTGNVPQTYRVETQSLQLPLAPGSVTPAASSTQTTDRPTLTANHKMSMYFAQLKTSMQWQVASDAGFTTNLKTITELAADFVYANATSTPYNGIVKASEVIPAISELNQGTWYVRAQSFDYGYNYGPYSSSQSFVITHPPVGTNLYPTAGQVFLYAGVGNVTFTWKFTDPSPYDSQSAYQIVVTNVNDGSTVVDSGKVTSTAQSATLAIPVGGKDVDLYWKLTLWDSDDVAGPASAPQVFYVTDPPAPAITSPANAAVLTTGNPTISWTTGIGGTKTQAAYRVLVTQGSNVMYSSDWVASQNTSHTLPVGYLSNSQQYTFRVEIKDNLNLQGFAEITVSTSWVPPLGPVDTWEVYLNEYAKRGFVYITWVDTNMDADFASWNVYRRQRGDASWIQVATVTSGASRYAARDYFVGSGRTYEYTITQMVNRFGDYVESVPTKIVRVSPDADNYWLIDPVMPSDSIPLYSVTADPFAEEYEQETIHIIGAGRITEYGDRLGYSGTITSQLRDKFVSGLARENYALNPAMSLESVNGAGPDGWTYASAGTIGEVSRGYYETRNPSPSGKTPYRVYSDGLGTATTDNIRLQQNVTGSDFPDRMKVVGTTVVLSAWVAISSLNADKKYRLSIQWMDSAGGLLTQVDSSFLDPILDGVQTYIPSSSVDGTAGNGTEIWRRLKFQTTVPAGTPVAGAALRIRLAGAGGTVSPGELILSGIQFEMDQLTDYFDGDQFGGSWSGTQYLSYSYGTGYYTARQQRQALEKIKAKKSTVYLRNPFGDIWKVAAGDIAAQRLAGVGKAEFVNVTMPYQEVIS